MEDLGSFIIVLIGAIAAIVNSVQKEKKKQRTIAAQPVASAARPPKQAAPAPQPAQAAPAAKPVSMASMLPRQESIPQPAQPQVHTHLDPDCAAHDAPSGSLSVTSPEGKDPCHEAQLTSARELLTEEVTQPGLTLDWSGDAMVKAFIMQEVLTRPCDRRKR